MAGFRARPGDSVDLRFIPHAAVTVFVDFGDGLLVDEASGQEVRGSLAIGLAPGSVRGRSRGIECLQVRVSPLVAYSALGASPEIGGTVAALDDLWGRGTERFRERLRAAPSWDERFAVAAAALARRQEAGRAVDPEVAFAWRQMVRNQGRVRVDELATAAGWSRKRLWARFRAQIGLTPKRAAQLIRFDHAAHRLAAGRSAAAVAADSGYADQSHLHHEIQAFAGMTPAAVSVTPWLAVDDIAWPSGRRAGN
jgi:AraC-like DNA-binding protein